MRPALSIADHMRNEIALSTRMQKGDSKSQIGCCRVASSLPPYPPCRDDWPTFILLVSLEAAATPCQLKKVRSIFWMSFWMLHEACIVVNSFAFEKQYRRLCVAAQSSSLRGKLQLAVRHRRRRYARIEVNASITAWPSSGSSNPDRQFAHSGARRLKLCRPHEHENFNTQWHRTLKH